MPTAIRESEGRADVECAGKNSSPGHCTGQSSARILNFVAHDGGEFQSDEAEANHAEGIQNEFRVSRNFEISGSDGASEARPHNHTEADQDRSGNECTDGAEVIDPFAHAQTEDVEDREQDQQRNRCGRCECSIVGKTLMSGSENVYRHAHEVEHDRRHVEHVVGPITPAGKKSVEVAEDFFRPQIDATFSGIAVR